MKTFFIVAFALVTIAFGTSSLDSLIISAQNGNVASQEALGEYYYNQAEENSYFSGIYNNPNPVNRFDVKVERSKSEALKWLYTAAENGSKKSYYYLGNYFSSCCWGEKNSDSSFYYWSEGAKRGEKQSLKKLAYLYLNGIGCEKDIKMAHILSWKAFLKGEFTTPLIWLVKILDIQEYVS